MTFNICELHRSDTGSSDDCSLPAEAISRLSITPHAHEPLPRAASSAAVSTRKRRGKYEDRSGADW